MTCVVILFKIKEDLSKNILRLFWFFAVFLIFITFWDILYITQFTGFDLFNKICSFIPLNQDLFVSRSVTSAQYLLSAIAQAQAAIIALVVTLTLVAIQLISQTSISKISDFFGSFKNYPFWLLLILYVVLISYAIIVLGSVDEMNKSLANRISYSIFLSVFALIALVPYIQNVLHNLKPENVLYILIKNVNKYNFEMDENLVSAVAIIKHGIKVYDIGLYHFGIDKLYEFFKANYETTEDIEKNIHIFCDVLEDIYIFSFLVKNEDAILKIENILNEMFTIFSKKNELKKELIIELIIKLFKNIGIFSVKHDMKESTYKMINSCMDIGLTNSKNALWYPTTWVVDAIGIVGIDIAKKGLFESGTAVYAIRYICDSGYENKLDYIEQITKRAKYYTIEIKNIADKKELDSVKLESEDALKMYDEIAEDITKKQIFNIMFTKNNILVIDNKLEDEQIGVRSFRELAIPIDSACGEEIKDININKYDLIYISSFANIKNELTEIREDLKEFLKDGGSIIVMCQSRHALGQSPSGKRIILHGIGDYNFLPDDPKYVHRQTRVFGDSIIIKNSDLFNGIFSKGSVRQMTAGDSVGYFSSVEEWEKIVLDNEGNALAAWRKFGNGLIFITTLYPDFRLVESSYSFFEAGIFLKNIIQFVLKSKENVK